MMDPKPILQLRDHDACVSCHRENPVVKVLHKNEGPWCFACFPFDRLEREPITITLGSVGAALHQIDRAFDRLYYD